MFLLSSCAILGSVLFFAPSSIAVTPPAGCPDSVDHRTGDCGGVANETYVFTATYTCRTSNAGACCKYEKVKVYCTSDGTYIGYFNMFVSSVSGDCTNGKCIPNPPPDPE